MRYIDIKHPGESQSSLKKSRTVHDQNYTLRELLNKFTTGQPITGMMSYQQYDGEYYNSKLEKPDFDGFLPDPNTLDLVDRQKLGKKLASDLAEKKSKAAEEEAEKRRKDKQESDELEEFKKHVREQKKNILENPAGGTDKK